MFSDIKTKDWFYKAVKKMVRLGRIAGYPDGSFRPGNYLTRAEYAAGEIAGVENAFAVIEEVKNSVCIISGPGGAGSGFLVAPDTIITNVHVSLVGMGKEYIDSLKVEFLDGTIFQGKQVTVPWGDGARDCAVLKIPEIKHIKPVSLAMPRPGETVFAIGCPVNLVSTVTKGIISHDRRYTQTMGIKARWIQTDAAINPGNSGGVLCNIYGEVVGMPTWKNFYTGEQEPRPLEGLSFCLHYEEILKVWEEAGRVLHTRFEVQKSMKNMPENFVLEGVL